MTNATGRRLLLLGLLLAIPLLWWQPYVHLSTEAQSPSESVPAGALLYMLTPACPPGYTVQDRSVLLIMDGLPDAPNDITVTYMAPFRVLLCLKGS